MKILCPGYQKKVLDSAFSYSEKCFCMKYNCTRLFIGSLFKYICMAFSFHKNNFMTNFCVWKAMIMNKKIHSRMKTVDNEQIKATRTREASMNNVGRHIKFLLVHELPLAHKLHHGWLEQ